MVELQFYYFGVEIQLNYGRVLFRVVYSKNSLAVVRSTRAAPAVGAGLLR